MTEYNSMVIDIWVRQQLSANETFIALQCLCRPTRFSFKPVNNGRTRQQIRMSYQRHSAGTCHLTQCIAGSMTHTTNIFAGHNAINGLKQCLIQLHWTV